MYDEWAQVEQERLRLRYLTALETRAQRHYEGRRWQAALADSETLLATDPLNETAVRLAMAACWTMEQREAARRYYAAYRQRVNRELQADPLPETSGLYQRILRGEAHPDQARSIKVDAALAARSAHLSLLETLGAFRQGLEQSAAWANKASGPAQAVAWRWQGRFLLHLGWLDEARAALVSGNRPRHRAQRRQPGNSIAQRSRTAAQPASNL